LGRGSLWGNEWWGTCKLPSMSTHVYDSWKNEKDKNLSNLAKSNSNISYIYIYMYLYIYLSVLCIHYEYLSTRATLIYLTCKREKWKKNYHGPRPFHSLSPVTSSTVLSLSLSLYLSIYLSMKSPSQLPPQYQHQLQLETPHYFNTLTTTAQTIYMFNIYDQNELFLSYHSLLVMENVCL
jgi:hypothetical protein